MTVGFINVLVNVSYMRTYRDEEESPSTSTVIDHINILGIGLELAYNGG